MFASSHLHNLRCNLPVTTYKSAGGEPWRCSLTCSCNLFVWPLHHRLRRCQVTHLFNLWSLFTESRVFALEPKCNFCFIPSRLHRPSASPFILPLSPLWGSQEEVIPYSPLADGASGSVCFQSCVSVRDAAVTPQPLPH